MNKISKKTKKNRKSAVRAKKSNTPEISVILPCRNEEEALPFCLNQIKEVIKKNHLLAEIIVSDSSSDKSPEIAKREKVSLLKHNQNGYGRAYLEAFKIAKGKYIFMADADATYDFNEIPNFVNWLKNGYDIVIGNRFGKRIEDGAMSFSNKYIGNPALSFMIRMLFGVKIKDSQCGMRAIKKEFLEKLNLQTTGMELASEIIAKAAKNHLKIKEVAIDYYKRKGQSKLRPILDGWRHIKFIFLFALFPRFFRKK